MLNVHPPLFQVPDSLLLHGMSEKSYQLMSIQFNQMLQSLDEGLEKNQTVAYFAQLVSHFLGTFTGMSEEDIVEEALSPHQYILSPSPYHKLYLNIQHPENRGQMLTSRSLNRLSYYELVLQVLAERYKEKTTSDAVAPPAYFLISNVFEWYIFSKKELFSLFEDQENLLQYYEGYQAGKPEFRSQESLYRLIDQVSEQYPIACTYFSLYGMKEGLSKSWESLSERLLPIGLLLQHLVQAEERAENRSFLLERELAYLLGLQQVPRAELSFYRLLPDPSHPIFHGGSKEDRRLASFHLHRKVLQEMIGNESLIQLEKQGVLGRKERDFVPGKESLRPFPQSGLLTPALDKALPPASYWESIWAQQNASSHSQLPLRHSSYAPLSASLWAQIWGSLQKESSLQAQHSPSFLGPRVQKQLQKLVLEKLNRQQKWNCKDWEELCQRVPDLPTHNLRQSLLEIKICDPNAGNGSFLLSILHEFTHIFLELGCLLDRSGNPLKDIQLLRVGYGMWPINDQGGLISYPQENRDQRAGSFERRVHEALFQSKWDIIHKCLYGLSASSFQCQVAKNILLLSLIANRFQYAGKEAFKWVSFSHFSPNLYPGNPLLSRLPLQSNPTEQKVSHLSLKDPRKERLTSLKSKFQKQQQPLSLWDPPVPEQAESSEEASESDQLEAQIRLIEDQLKDPDDFWGTYLDWEQLFPFLWDPRGLFTGFDAVFTAPLSLRQDHFRSFTPYLKERFASYHLQAHYSIYLMELGIRLVKNGGRFSFITPNKWLGVQYAEKFRKWMEEQAIFTYEGMAPSSQRPADKLRHPLWVSGRKKYPVDKL